MIVVDASVAVKWFVEEDGHHSALSLLDGLALVTVDLVFAETINVIWKKLRRGEMTSEQAEKACHALPNFFRGVFSTAALAEDALVFARQLDHSVYDCVYLACAQRQGTKLVTADAKFVSRVAAHGLSHLVLALDDAQSLLQAGTDHPLSISDTELNRVLDLYAQFRRTMSFVEDAVRRPFGDSPVKFVNTADLGPAFDSPAYLNLQSAIRDLPQEHVGDLVALGWLGRGFDGHDWRRLREQADAIGNDPPKHLGYVIQLLTHVHEGARKLSSLHDQSSPQVSPDTNPET